MVSFFVFFPSTHTLVLDWFRNMIWNIFSWITLDTWETWKLWRAPTTRMPCCGGVTNSTYVLRFHDRYLTQCNILISLGFAPQVRHQVFFPDKWLVQYDCGKLQTLALLLSRLKRGHHRCLIFTQMTKMLNVLERFLCLHGYTYFRLDGRYGENTAWNTLHRRLTSCRFLKLFQHFWHFWHFWNFWKLFDFFYFTGIVFWLSVVLCTTDWRVCARCARCAARCARQHERRTTPTNDGPV